MRRRIAKFATLILLVSSAALGPAATAHAAAGDISTVAGNGSRAFSGDGGPAANASLVDPESVALDSSGNLYIGGGDDRVRRVSPSGTISTIIGNGTYGYSGDGGPALAASITYAFGIAIDASGNLYIADRDNGRIRRVDSGGTISTFAGNGSFGYSGDGGLATDAGIGEPWGIALDASSNLYIAALNTNRVRRVSSGGTITTVAGNGSSGFSGDGGPATSASLASPTGVAVDSSGNLFIADFSNRRVRMVNPSGIITTVAGNGSPVYSGDGGPATDAGLTEPYDVTLDASSNLYIADEDSEGTQHNCRVRRVSTSGTITTVAGSGECGFSGDGGPATSARLYVPQGVALDSANNLYIADSANQRVRKVEGSSQPLNTLVGLGDSIAAGHGLGFARGVDADHPAGDNSNAYPHVLGRRLGWSSVDFAVTGACSASAQDPRAFGSTPKECDHSVLTDQLPQLRASGLHPSLITLNVGANDIRFADCIAWYIVPVKPAWLDPCENRNLHVHLAALKQNLSLVLTELSSRFPSAQVIITKYYNPLPRPPAKASGSDVCRPLYVPLALVQHTQQFLSGPVANELAVRQTQTEAWSFAQRVTTELNSTLDSAVLNAQGNVRMTAAPDFSGHDLCHVQTGGSVSDTWVFGPRLNVSYFWHFLLRSGSGNFNLSMPSACPDEEYEPDWSPLFGSIGANNEPISSWGVFATLHTNCAPHPTPQGQAQLASLVQALL